MYSPDKMKSGGGLMGPPGCFPGRYSPTYRSADPRRCVPNPSCWRDQKRKARLEGGDHSRAVNATGNAIPVPDLSNNSALVLCAIGPEMAVGMGPAESEIGMPAEILAAHRVSPRPPPPAPPAAPLRNRRVRRAIPCETFLNAQLELNQLIRSRILEDASLMCNSWSPRHNGDIFGGLNDGLLSRAEALAAVDIGKHQTGTQAGPPLGQLKHDMVYHHGVGGPPPHNTRPHQMGHHGMEGLDMLDPLSSTSMTTLAPMGEANAPHHMHGYGMNHVMNHHHHHGGGLGGHGPATHLSHPAAALHPDTDTDPRELEAFAERFKQRRIKLGVTQADVGKALANLKLPGVGALSQSTICRFESLTLSHNNMIALKPILQAWLEEAEAQAKNKRRDPDAPSVLPAGEKKRKRTSIAAPEKRSLEAYFAVQPRPSGEKITAIAEKLDLKKNVVRVWFCNQRQKQKRMKFAAQH